MMTITNATKKDELVKEIKSNLTKLKKNVATKGVQELIESINYALKMYAKDVTKVTKKDLVELVTKADRYLSVPASADSKPKATLKAPVAKAVAEKKAEASIKKPVSSEKKVDKTKAENNIKPIKGAPKSEKKAEKTADKTSEKKSSVTPIKEDTPLFPETFSVKSEDGEIKYTLVKGIKNMKEMCKALAENEDYIIAWYWSKDDARKDYLRLTNKCKGLKGFDNNLDISVPIYISDDEEIIYTVSSYTEISYGILPYEVEENEGYRIAGGVKYQIYKEA